MEDNSNFKTQNVQEMNIVKLRISKITRTVFIFFSKRRKKKNVADSSPADIGLYFNPLHASYS